MTIPPQKASDIARSIRDDLLLPNFGASPSPTRNSRQSPNDKSPLPHLKIQVAKLTCDKTTINLLLFSFSSAPFGTLACTGAILPPTPGLLELGRGFVTREAAIAAAARDEVACIDSASASASGSAPAAVGAEEEVDVDVGLKTGAEADIFDAFIGPGWVGVDVEARRLGGVVLRVVDMAERVGFWIEQTRIYGRDTASYT